VTDYNFIKAQVKQLCEQYLVQIIEYDRYNASQMVIDLGQEGVPMQPFGQGFISMNAPTKELERLVLDNKIHHYGHPVLAWMMGNIELERDAADNIKISKGTSKEKVDGAVALVEAIGGYMTAPAPQISVYEERGLRVL
jgi:phage terminase large subunit-like protein